jgi:hypothetical protein
MMGRKECESRVISEINLLSHIHFSRWNDENYEMSEESVFRVKDRTRNLMDMKQGV